MTKAKLTRQDDYAKANGYDVTLQVTYERVRKVRAMDPEQAMEFAVIRESDYASRYFNSSSHIHFQVKDVDVVDVRLAAERLGKNKTEE